MSINKDSQKAPILRFKGFTDDWEERKLKDISEKLDYGLNAAAKSYDGINKYLRITDIDENSRLFNLTNLSSPNYDLEKADDYLLDIQDILFARTGASVGKTYKYKTSDGKVYFAGFLIRARIKNNFNPYFVFQNTLTNKYYNYVKVVSQRSGQPGINSKEYGEFPLFIPKFEEQTKIGSFLKKLDNTITLHQRKLDQLKQLKEALLQQMFPGKGETVPKLRFAGFEGDWEDRKLGDLLHERNQKSVQTEEYPLVSFTVENGVTEKTERYNRNQLVSGDSDAKVYKVTKLNDIVYNPANLKFGAIDRNKYGKAVFSPIYVTFEVIEDYIFAEFIEFIVTSQTFIGRALKYQQGTVYERQSVGVDDFLSLNIRIPNLDEQKLIGLFLNDLNKEILLQKEKLDQLKNMKQVLLQNMFI